MKITFGKHAGKEVSELTHEYCSALLGFSFGQKNLTPELTDAIEKRVTELEATPEWKARNNAHWKKINSYIDKTVALNIKK